MPVKKTNEANAVNEDVKTTNAKETAAAAASEDKPVKKAAAKKTAAKKTTTKKAAATKKTTAKKAAVKEEPKAEVKAEPAKEEAATTAIAVKPKAEVAVKPKAEVAVKEKAEVTVVDEPKAKAEEVKAEPAKEEPVKEEAKPAKKTAAKKTTAKKTTTKKAAAKEEPKAEEVKAEEPKAEVKAEPVKEEPKAKAEEVKAEPAKEEPAKEEAKPAKKPASKKAAAKEEPKAEVKAEPAKKAAAKKTAAKKAEPVVEEVKVEAVPEVKEEVKVEAAPEVKEEVKEEVKAPFMDMTDEKIAAYNEFPVETLLEMANALGTARDMETLKNELAVAMDIAAYTQNDLMANVKKDHGYVFEDDGFDETVIIVLVDKVLDTIPVKSSDYQALAKEVEANKDYQLTGDPMRDAEEYHKLFDLVRQLLMIGQKQNINSLDELKKIVPADNRKLIETFMDVAYNLLPSWQYNDVKYYQGFLFSVLTQFEDLADLYNRGMMDVADLYIKHGDYGRGDADYNYVIRENQLKDYIFFRFANVYRPIDLQKAKNIANGALRYVDGRYTYYPNLIEILNS